MYLTITGNKVAINNNEYELPNEVISFMVKKILKMDDVIEENEELKKQLKATEEVAEEHMKKWVTMEAQQKEFIKYLEDEMKRIKAADIYDSFKKASLVTFQHILSNYKEIIGSDKE